MTTISSSTANQQNLGAAILGALGVGNGMNINSIVTQLVAAEGQPVLSQISTQQSAINTQLSGLGQLQSALSSFQSTVTALETTNSFQANLATTSNSAILTVTPGSGAVAASHNVEVDQLAAQQSSITTAEFANSAAVVGTGSLTFTLGSGTTFDVNIDSTNNTLAGVANAINNAKGNSAVQASIINVDSAQGTGTVSKLVLTSTNTGTANAFTVSGTDADGDNADNLGLSQLFSANLANQSTAKDSIIKVDGQTATNSSNALSNVIPGVTLNLQSAAVGTNVTVGVSLNNNAITSALNSFISAYNNLTGTISNLQAYGGVGGTNGALFGNPALDYISNQVRSITTSVVSSVSGGYNSLAMIGLTIDKTGAMSLNNTQLNTALAANPQAVNNVFNGKGGIASSLAISLTSLNGSTGPLSSQTNTLHSQLAALKKQQTAENNYLDGYQARLQQEYAAMQSIVSKYNSTGTFLTSWINNLNGTSSTKG